MLTIEHIDDLHTRLGKAETLFEYARALKAIGVETYDSYLIDGHSEYFTKDGHKLVSPPYHEVLLIAETSDKKKFLKSMELVELGQLGYLEMSKALAESGIEKWTVNTAEATMTYCDKAGNELLFERLNELG